MSYAIESEIEGFKDRITRIAKNGKVSGIVANGVKPVDLNLNLDVNEVCDYGFVLSPSVAHSQLTNCESTRDLPRDSLDHDPSTAGNPKDIALTLSAIIHGNETAGVAVLNGILEQILAGMLVLKVPIGFVLGNVPAARADRRFIGRDLNRSFGRSYKSGQTPVTPEENRALELEQILGRTRFLLDIHQTSRISDRAFFIFPYRSSAVEFARAINPQATIVTHWGTTFSKEGQCSDEFVNAHGGLGVTVELGQNGFDSYQIALGLDMVRWAIWQVTHKVGSGQWLSRASMDLSTGPDVDSGQRKWPEIYTWAQIVPWPKGDYVELLPGMNNFITVSQGQLLGFVDGQPIHAPVEGRVLFAKYLNRDEQLRLKDARPTELIRIMRPCKVGELPTILA